MTVIHWHLRITLESSAKQFVEQMADADRRSAANYVRILIEKDMEQKDRACRP